MARLGYGTAQCPESANTRMYTATPAQHANAHAPSGSDRLAMVRANPDTALSGADIQRIIGLQVQGNRGVALPPRYPSRRESYMVKAKDNHGGNLQPRAGFGAERFLETHR